jgi:segregation and condensation protein B
MTLEGMIEAMLFASGKPFTLKRLAELTDKTPDEVKDALQALESRLDEMKSGIMLQRQGHEVELVTRPEVSDLVKRVVKAESSGELTRPSLEALTILAYRGPLTRPELEQIRGVQSSMILRNLMLRGLIEEKEEVRLGQPTYAVTFDFLNALGLSSLEDLPDFEELHHHQTVESMLTSMEEVKDEAK